MHQLDVHQECIVESLSATSHRVSHHERHHAQYMETNWNLMKLVFVILGYVKKVSSFSMQSLVMGIS
jgi:hypothetical protein